MSMSQSEIRLLERRSVKAERELAEARELLKKARSAVIYERPHALVVSEIEAFLTKDKDAT